MAVNMTIDESNKSAVISIEGAFEFKLVQEFRKCYSERKDLKYVIDLRKVDYIDSAGLGMLLNMHKFLSQGDGSIRIINTLPQVRKILLISRFDKKFVIE